MLKGLHLWLSDSGKLLFRAMKRDYEIIANDMLTSTEIVFDAWNFIAVSYNYTSGQVSVWLDGNMDETIDIGER